VAAYRRAPWPAVAVRAPPPGRLEPPPGCPMQKRAADGEATCSPRALGTAVGCVSDALKHGLVKITHDLSHVVATWGTFGTGSDQLYSPTGLALGPDGPVGRGAQQPPRPCSEIGWPMGQPTHRAFRAVRWSLARANVARRGPRSL